MKIISVSWIVNPLELHCILQSLEVLQVYNSREFIFFEMEKVHQIAKKLIFILVQSVALWFDFHSSLEYLGFKGYLFRGTTCLAKDDLSYFFHIQYFFIRYLHILIIQLDGNFFLPIFLLNSQIYSIRHLKCSKFYL